MNDQSQYTPTINDIGREVICLTNRGKRGILMAIRGSIASVKTLDTKIVTLVVVDDLRLTLKSARDRTRSRLPAKDSTGE
jgi:hypothetical protein